MTFPSNAVMCVLLAIHRREPLEPVDGVLTVRIPLRTVELVVENVSGELDELESREWVVIAGEYPTLTEKGRYVLRRWRERMVIVDTQTKQVKRRAA